MKKPIFDMKSPKPSKVRPLRAMLVGLGFLVSQERKQSFGVKRPLHHLVGWMQ